MYRLIVESLLGLNLEAGRLRFAPCLPPNWNEFARRYRYRETCYDITVRRSALESSDDEREVNVTLDGIAQPSDFVLLADDRAAHVVDVRVQARNRIVQAGTGSLLSFLRHRR